ncbi:MAG: ABC transporter ATP-binding protein [Pirellulales bacterium]|nr:ABC transporter ATP-binding protein [Pirellulales bacterium]
MKPVIRFERVAKRFGTNTALDDFSLDVPPGVVFALLGENGAGKTTAIRIMLGLLPPSAGRADVFGLDAARHGLDIRRRVGYVPEQLTLYDWMTVAQIGWFTAGFYGPGFLPRYDRLVAEFHLPPGQKIKALSKGMRAKVALSLALADDPEVLVLDEPTSGLDAIVRREFLQSMVDRAATGKTVFLSSHQIHEVERVADVVAILRHGRLALVEPLDRLKASIREVTMTLTNPTGDPPKLPGTLLGRTARGRQWQLLVRDVPEEQLAKLDEHDGVAGVEIRAPSLEEIFVAYMRAEPAGAVEEVSP